MLDDIKELRTPQQGRILRICLDVIQEFLVQPYDSLFSHTPTPPRTCYSFLVETPWVSLQLLPSTASSCTMRPPFSITRCKIVRCTRDLPRTDDNLGPFQENARAMAWTSSSDSLATSRLGEATATFLRQLSDNGRAPWPAILKWSEKTRAIEVWKSRCAFKTTPSLESMRLQWLARLCNTPVSCSPHHNIIQ